MAQVNVTRPPALTLFYAWQLTWQGVSLDVAAEFLQRDKQKLLGLMFGRVEQDNAEVQGVRRWAREMMRG